MNIDLHTHSYFSDGECSPEEVILEAKKQTVSVLSITDHNIIGYNEETRRVAKKHNISFIEGIEVSTLYRLSNNPISLHVLGYSNDFNKPLLQEALLKTIDGYNDRAQKIITKLNHEFPDIHLDFKKMKNENYESYISRNTLARLLTEHVKILSIKEALKQYVFVEEDDDWMIDTENSFRLIKKAGGVSVLAHSGRELRKMGSVAYENMIRHFTKCGMRGLEVYYPKHTLEEIYTMKNIAKKYKLHLTGGSDWHGSTYTPNISVGIDDRNNNVATFLKKVIGISL